MAIKNPVVSVVIPVFNSEKYVRKALDSVFDQNYRPLEVIIVDDGSTDSSARAVDGYKDARYIYQANHGVARARNTGIAASQGEIIAFLDSDDIWPTDRLNVTVRYLLQCPEIDYVLGRELMFVEPDYVLPPSVKAEWLTEPHDATNTGVLVARRETFACVGLFNTDFRSDEDTEWLVRAGDAGVPMARLPEVILHRRLHSRNLSFQMKHMHKANLFRIARESIRRRQRK
jgi:glycosyltransferase involved in cell wall biosynthesis